MLSFLLGLVMVVGLILAAIAYRPVRWILGGIAALIALGVLFLFQSQEDSRRQREAALHRVTAQQLQFEDMALGQGRLTGRVRNLSAYTVTNIELVVTLQDCVGGGSRCDVVGQTNEDLYLTIPPGQVRGVDESIYFSNVPAVRGTRQWEYSVTSISAN